MAGRAVHLWAAQDALQPLRSLVWGARETQIGVATGRRLAALRPDLPFTLIDNTKACPDVERPTAVIDVIRADI